MWQLIINGPGYFDTAYDLPEGVTHVGRADENDIVLSGDLVSRRHARYHVAAGEVRLEDLGSRNGTRLNGAPATGTSPLGPGDVVVVGENTMVLRRAARAEVEATEMLDVGAGGAVRRFGRGADIQPAVVVSRPISQSSVLRALDNFAPGPEGTPPPVSQRSMTDTDEDPGQTPPGDSGERGSVSFASLVLLYRVAESLARAPALQPFLEETCDLLMQRVGATTAVVLLRHGTGVMVPLAVRHTRKLQRGEVPVSDAIIDAALAQGQAIAVADVRDDRRFAERESVVVYGIDQVLCIPVGKGAPFLGVLYLNRASVSAEKVEGLLDVCTAIAQLVQTGIEKFQPARQEPEARVRRSMERYFAPDVVQRRLAELRPGQAAAAMSEHTLTCVHVEVVGLEAQAARLDRDRLAALLSDFRTVCARLFLSFEGTVWTFQGEGADVVFGAPFPRGDDGIRAVRASLVFRAEWQRVLHKLGPTERFPVRLGLTTGKGLAGLVGPESRLEFEVLGDVPFLARLVAASADPGQILITAKTLASIGARFDVTPLGERALQGSRLRTAVFEVLDEDSETGTLSGIR